MKFLAILRDSIREAMDFKVIYFLFALSGLVILFAASISYKPDPAEKGLEEIVNRLPGGHGGFGGRGMGPVSYQIEDLKQVNESRPVWEGEFHCVLVATESDFNAGQDDHPADPADGKQEKKDKKAQQGPSTLRLLALLDLIKKQSEGKLEDEEDRETFEKLKKLNSETITEVEKITKRSGGQPLPPVMMRDLFAKSMEKGLALINRDQVRRFLQSNLSASGTMTVTKFKLMEEKDKTYRFDLECKARPETIRTWPHTPVLFFGAVTLPFKTGIAPLVMTVENWIVTGLGAGLTLLLSTVITASFVPSMMRKGTVDLLISKPIHRWYLLVCKYIGGMSFMFINTVVIIAGIWLVLGIRSGLWSTGFLLGIFVLTLQFAILYSVSVLMGVLTRNPIATILVTCAWWFVLFLFGNAYFWVNMFREADFMPKWVIVTGDVLHYTLPHYKDLDMLSTQLIARDLLPVDSPELANINKLTETIQWPASLGITFGFIAIILALASWRFTVKDY